MKTVMRYVLCCLAIGTGIVIIKISARFGWKGEPRKSAEVLSLQASLFDVFSSITSRKEKIKPLAQTTRQHSPIRRNLPSVFHAQSNKTSIFKDEYKPYYPYEQDNNTNYDSEKQEQDFNSEFTHTKNEITVSAKPDIGHAEKANGELRPFSIGVSSVIPNMTIYADIDATKEKLAQRQTCLPVLDNPLSFWRSQPQATNFTAETDYERISQAVLCGGLLMRDYLQTPPKKTLYDFEVPYLSDPPFSDINLLSNETYSSVVLFNTSKFFQVGDTVALQITIRDGQGQVKVKGGDELRAWFVDRKYRGRKMAGRIIDYDNGTYLATSILPFAGELRVKVALAYPREYIQTLMRAHLLLKSFAFYAGAFVNSQANETTFCYHTPVIPGFKPSETCNLTQVNGSPWFCGRPMKRLLACSDYHYSRLVPNDIVVPLTPTEYWLLNRPRQIRWITSPSTIQIFVKPRKKGNETIDRLQPTIACNQVPARQTWTQLEAAGYYYDWTWKPLLCQLPEEENLDCWKNRELVFLGDSVGRKSYYHVLPKSQCTELKKGQGKHWHKPLVCVHKSNNFTVKWLPHSNPFQSSKAKWSDIQLNKASSILMKEMANTSRYLIHLNHYLHLSPFHLSAFVEKMLSLKNALQLFVQNPNVTAVLQGPHIMWDFYSPMPYVVSDSLSRFMIAIQREVFRDMMDQLIYLPTKDITIAAKNVDKHPKICPDIFKLIVGFMCGRK